LTQTEIKTHNTMKTVREWLNELPEEIRERAIRNAEKSDWGDIECTDKGSAIAAAFDWEDSLEGYFFWKEWEIWLFDPTQPKPTIKPADEVDSDHIPDVRKMVGEPKNDTLSRRDQFAMAAMQAIITNKEIGGPSYFEKMAEFAVEAAEALIQELDKQQP
jgi:hypothetical protein